MKFKNKRVASIASVGLIWLLANQLSFGQNPDPKEFESKLRATAGKDKETNKKRTLDDIRSKLKLNDSQGASEGMGMGGGMSSGMGPRVEWEVLEWVGATVGQGEAWSCSQRKAAFRSVDPAITSAIEHSV